MIAGRRARAARCSGFEGVSGVAQLPRSISAAAAERNLEVSLHCLQAWGRLFDLLKAGPRPERGFLPPSYGGPQEMLKPLADLGAYFSLLGYFAHERKQRQHETFRHVPHERLLIETDAPDQLLPETGNAEGGTWYGFGGATVFPLTDSGSGRRLNHPANLAAVYAFAGTLLGEPLESLAVRVEENSLRLFGGLGHWPARTFATLRIPGEGPVMLDSTQMRFPAVQCMR